MWVHWDLGCTLEPTRRPNGVFRPLRNAQGTYHTSSLAASPKRRVLLTHARHLVSLPPIRRRQPPSRRRLQLRPNHRRPHTHPRPHPREADLVHPQGTPAGGAPRVSCVPTAAVGGRRVWLWRGRVGDGGDGVDGGYLWEARYGLFEAAYSCADDGGGGG